MFGTRLFTEPLEPYTPVVTSGDGGWGLFISASQTVAGFTASVANSSGVLLRGNEFLETVRNLTIEARIIKPLSVTHQPVAGVVARHSSPATTPLYHVLAAVDWAAETFQLSESGSQAAGSPASISTSQNGVYTVRLQLNGASATATLLAPDASVLASLTRNLTERLQPGAYGLFAQTNADRVDFDALYASSIEPLEVVLNNEMWALLGSEYQQDDEVLRVLFAVIAPVMQRATDAIDRIGTNFNPDTAPDEWLSWLLASVGWPVDETLTVYQKREILKRLANWRRRYGQVGVIEEIIQWYFRPSSTVAPPVFSLKPRDQTDGGFRIGKGRIGKSRIWQRFSRNVIRVAVAPGSAPWTAAEAARLERLLDLTLPPWMIFELTQPPEVLAGGVYYGGYYDF
jgi:phage tail-like protein